MSHSGAPTAVSWSLDDRLSPTRSRSQRPAVKKSHDVGLSRFRGRHDEPRELAELVEFDQGIATRIVEPGDLGGVSARRQGQQQGGVEAARR